VCSRFYSFHYFFSFLFVSFFAFNFLRPTLTPYFFTLFPNFIFTLLHSHFFIFFLLFRSFATILFFSQLFFFQLFCFVCVIMIIWLLFSEELQYIFFMMHIFHSFSSLSFLKFYFFSSFPLSFSLLFSHIYFSTFIMFPSILVFLHCILFLLQNKKEKKEDFCSKKPSLCPIFYFHL
jgi:hypothetical protein